MTLGKIDEKKEGDSLGNPPSEPDGVMDKIKLGIPDGSLEKREVGDGEGSLLGCKPMMTVGDIEKESDGIKLGVRLGEKLFD